MKTIKRRGFHIVFDESAGQRGMSADRRFDKTTPDARGFIAIPVIAEGKHDAILQGIEIECHVEEETG